MLRCWDDSKDRGLITKCCEMLVDESGSMDEEGETVWGVVGGGAVLGGWLRIGAG